ncbi:tetratricopeptide repeat protein [Cellulosilyticum ruminicola]|uniref:tetratricopeptide repeat protein n=1 Tax=Cellulosilyticum ruminicola TaxID=425254 RepID=UPI0006D272D0|nr:tetratricopeptide repeat protein [Cellulosilyticum ruminicola]
MVEVCPYCGGPLTYEDECRKCGKPVAWAKKCYLKSEAYYIQGFKAAKLRNLTNAKELLRQAIYFNKYHIEARNLLGLIHYEMGEMGLALKSWILSTSLKKENNIASDYIARVQKDPRALERYTDASNLYNKALNYLNDGNEDVATIRLKKAVGIQPNLIEARILLGLCYIKSNQIRKAKEQLEEVLNIDHHNTRALAYLSEIKDKQVEEIMPFEKEYGAKKQAGKAFDLNRNKLILGGALCFLVGLIVMAIIPRPSVNIQSYKKQIAKLENENKELNTAMDTLKLENEKELNDLKAENKKLESDNAVYTGGTNEVGNAQGLNQEGALGTGMTQQDSQEKLAECESLISQGEYEEAAAMLYSIGAEGAMGADFTKYTELKQTAYAKAAESLCNKGYNDLHNENFSEAKTSLDVALSYATDEDYNKKRILYYLGKTEVGLGDTMNARTHFDAVIENYPETEEAQWSRYALNDIESN